MFLSIIIITHNSEKFIKNCIDSVSRQNNITKELIIIDNFSIDNRISTFKKKYIKIRNIVSKTNFGFAKACNQGAKIANGKYLLFLNPDTIIRPYCIKEMIRFLDSKKDAGLVGCKILNPDGSLQPSCGNFPTIFNIVFDRVPVINKIFKTELIRRDSYYQKEECPDWISGSFFLVRKDVFLKLGGFDEEYFMYAEDIDFCYRVRKAGYKVYYNPNAEIIHYDMGKSKERKGFKAKNMRKGFSIYFRKYKSPLYFSLWRSILRVESLFKVFLNITI